MLSIFFRASSRRSSASRQKTRYSAIDVESWTGEVFCSSSSTASASSYAADAYNPLARWSVSSFARTLGTTATTPMVSTRAAQLILVTFIVASGTLCDELLRDFILARSRAAYKIGDGVVAD